ncbi:S8 family serine peptidase [Burkholderia pyrrocinia]
MKTIFEYDAARSSMMHSIAKKPKTLAILCAALLLSACRDDDGINTTMTGTSTAETSPVDANPDDSKMVNDNILTVQCHDTPMSNDESLSALSAVSIGDPLYDYQWYLKNIGQRVFADTRPCSGVDINIGSLHESGIRGRGVTVAVVDSGLDIRHEDLIANVVPGGSVNFEDGSRDPVDIGGHGTAVAGIIAAVGWNGVGGRGVAPEASLKGFNAGEMIYSGTPAEQQMAFRKYFGYSWGEGREARNVDIFNNSLGLQPTGLYPTVSHEDIQEWDALMGSTRGGRGGIYVWAGGNGFLQPKDILTNDDQNAGCDANKIGLSCVSTTFDTPSNFINMITVASVNARGVRSYFSSAGPSIWVSGPGGEDGAQQAYAGAGKRSYGPGIVTTDVSGCSEGLNISTSRNNALDEGTVLDPLCNYSASFSGTSSAAPMISGIAALMLGVNPALTQRDVKYILATTARPLDLEQPKISYRGMLVEPGWIKNAAGFQYSNWYGFGLADASAAVTVAKNFKTLPPVIDTGWVHSPDAPVRIGGSESSGTMKIRIGQNISIESVQFSLNTSHEQPTNLTATLISPSGTISYVLPPLSNLEDTENFSIPLSSSNAFFGEQSQGEWLIRLTDVSGKPVTAELQKFQLRIVGHVKVNQSTALRT